MITIREGCFETNSSSAHCLVITKNDNVFSEEEIQDSLYIWDDNKVVHVTKEYYGRSPFKIIFNDFRDKFMYTLGSLCNEYGDDYWNECENFLKKYGVKQLIANSKDINIFQTQKEAEDYCDRINKRLVEHGLEDKF